MGVFDKICLKINTAYLKCILECATAYPEYGVTIDPKFMTPHQIISYYIFDRFGSSQLREACRSGTLPGILRWNCSEQVRIAPKLICGLLKPHHCLVRILRNAYPDRPGWRQHISNDYDIERLADYLDGATNYLERLADYLDSATIRMAQSPSERLPNVETPTSALTLIDQVERLLDAKAKWIWDYEKGEISWRDADWMIVELSDSIDDETSFVDANLSGNYNIDDVNMVRTICGNLAPMSSLLSSDINVIANAVMNRVNAFDMACLKINTAYLKCILECASAHPEYGATIDPKSVIPYQIIYSHIANNVRFSQLREACRSGILQLNCSDHVHMAPKWICGLRTCPLSKTHHCLVRILRNAYPGRPGWRQHIINDYDIERLADHLDSAARIVAQSPSRRLPNVETHASALTLIERVERLLDAKAKLIWEYEEGEISQREADWKSVELIRIIDDEFLISEEQIELLLDEPS
jgi:hypothetical protein